MFHVTGKNMEILKLDRIDGIDEKETREIKKIKRAADVLRSGGLVIYPTDTLYGLGANALDKNAVKKVFEVKNRPPDMPIPVAVSSIEMLKEYAVMGENDVEFAKRFLPGALTLILKRKNLPDIISPNTDTVALRIPKSDITLKLIKYAGVPITTTSANISGEKPPLTAREAYRALKDIKDIDIILDGGPLKMRVPSTIFDLTQLKILREGQISKDLLIKAGREIYGR